MVTDVTAGPAKDHLDSRPRVLMLPSATGSRLIVLVVAMLTSGLFVGTAVYNAILGQSWVRGVNSCLNTAANGTQARSMLSCAASGEWQRATFALTATVIITAVAAAIMLLAPSVLRRRRKLRSAVEFSGAIARLADLAREVGVRAPALLVGRASQRDAFCLGYPGHYAIVLPIALALKPSAPVFEAVARHELAHILHHDVAVSWLARSVWYALAPALAFPLVLFVAHGDAELGLDYVWRAVVLAAVVLLVQRAVLRSREHDADLRACYAPGVEPVLVNLLARQRSSTRPLARLRAMHPDGPQRREVIERPERVTRIGVLDGTTIGFLAALALPLLDSTLNALVVDNSNALFVSVAGTVLIGVLLGTTLGVGLWRQAVVSRAVGARPQVTGIVLGMLLGTVLGQIVSFANVGLGSLTGADHPLVILVVALAMTGTTALVAGLGVLWSGSAGRLSVPGGVWVPAAAFAVMLFAGVLWASDLLQNAWDQGGWAIAGQLPLLTLATAPMGFLILILAIASGWSLRSTSPLIPIWLSPGRPSTSAAGSSAVPRLRLTLLAGLVGGIAGGLVLAGFQLIAGTATTDEDLVRRVLTFEWVAGGAGSAAFLALALTCGRRGVGAGLLAGPLATDVVVLIFFILNWIHGGSITMHVLSGFLLAAVVVGLLLSVLAACLSLGSDSLRRTAYRPSALQVCAVTVLLSATVSAATLSARNTIVPVVTEVYESSSSSGVPSSSQDVQFYLVGVVPLLSNERLSIGTNMTAIVNDSTATQPEKGQMILDRIVTPLQQDLAAAQNFQSPDPAVNEVHQYAILALQYSITAYQTFAQALNTGSSPLLQQGLAERDRAFAEWHTWILGAGALPR
jgi:Zn-dependent protease with chaperone function